MIAITIVPLYMGFVSALLKLFLQNDYVSLII